MVDLNIRGGSVLSGSVLISGAKNSSMPILIASILTDEKVVVENVPYVTDVVHLLSLLTKLGMEISSIGDSPLKESLELRTPALSFGHDSCAQASMIRTSVLLMGPALARGGYAKLLRPGGCQIGERKIDLHVFAMERLGAVAVENEGVLELTTYGKRLRGAEIDFPTVSVGATENALMAATLAEGVTIIKNAAIEPEIDDLIVFLNKMGAKISKIAEREILIEGVESLHSARHAVIPDRIEAVTYAMLAAITNGEIVLHNVAENTFKGALEVLDATGVSVTPLANFDGGFGSVLCKRKGEKLSPITIETNPYPFFATDLQPPLMVLLALAEGESQITENIFENRFQHVKYLNSMGANIVCNGKVAKIRGVKSLIGARVEGTDLRASAALAMAGIVAKGNTIVSNIEILDRGYHNFVKNLVNCGGSLERVYSF